MLAEMSCLIGGVPLGFLLRSRKEVVRATEAALIWSVRILLFLLGLSLGGDEVLMSSLGSIGLKGAFISICCLAGTLLGVRLLDPFLNREAVPDPTSKEDLQ